MSLPHDAAAAVVVISVVSASRGTSTREVVLHTVLFRWPQGFLELHFMSNLLSCKARPSCRRLP